MQTTLGTAVFVAVAVWLVYKFVQSEKVRNSLWTGCGFFLAIMVIMNLKSAKGLVIGETKNWWPVFVDVMTSVSSMMRDMLHTFTTGG